MKISPLFPVSVPNLKEKEKRRRRRRKK